MHAAPDTPPRPARGPALSTLLELASPAEAARLEGLLAAWTARFNPADEAETSALEAIVVAIWRRERLLALEARLFDRLARGLPADDLPTLPALARAEARIAKDRARAEADLAHLRSQRPPDLLVPILEPARLHWLARKLEEGRVKSPTAPAREFPGHPAWRPPAPEPLRAATDAAERTAPGPEAPAQAAPERPAATPARRPAAAQQGPAPQARAHAAPEPSAPAPGPVGPAPLRAPAGTPRSALAAGG